MFRTFFFAVPWLTSTLIAYAPIARANPFDVVQTELAADVVRDGQRAQGILPLLELARNYDRATPSHTRDLLVALSENPRLSTALRAYAEVMLARVELRMGQPDAAAQRIRDLGSIVNFRVIGPFDNDGKAGFETEMPPEAERRNAVDFDARYEGRERPVGWRLYPNISPYGYVNFDAIFRPRSDVCAFAETTVHSESEQPLTLWLGAGGAFKAFWNGDEVFRDERYRQPHPDRHLISVTARSGVNRLLLKVCAASATWGLYARLTNPNGTAASGLRFDAAEGPALGPASGRTRPARHPQSILMQLETAAERGGRAGPAHDLARFLVMTGADDAAENRAKQLAFRAAEREPTIPHIVFAASLADQRGDLTRFEQQAARIDESSPRSLLLRAMIRSKSPHPQDALPLIARIPAGTPEALDAAVVRATILRDIELPETAFRVVRDATTQADSGAYWLRELAKAALDAGHADEAIAYHEQSLAARYDDIETRQALVRDALYRQQTEIAQRHLAVVLDLRQDSSTHIQYVASIQDSLDRTTDALETLRRGEAIAPEDPDLHVAMGRLLLRAQQNDAAIDHLRRAVALRPQDRATQELLEQLEPQARQDEAYAIATDELLGRRQENSGFPIHVLADVSVTTVFENGLGSRFRQYAVQINDQEGARQWRTYSIQFDPGAQRVDLRRARVYRQSGQVLESVQTIERQLGEPWYRIYYDTRASVVVFPDLEPGDIVEVQYRVDDVGHHNLFADYFGDLSILQGFAPSVRSDYVLITPTSRDFYFNEPGLESLQHEQRVEGQQRIDHFWAENIPAIRREDGMPGTTEIAPYLLVSTYRTWEEVGRWYWGLIRDQLYADESLQATVRGLVAGTTDLRTKVTRIYNWVIQNTRYVGLEFGIHGYKPYRVPQIVSRGFGDCKDKASLMFTMLREAGIDAHIILARTRRNGAINDLPASLSVFDHAIAYVPELDLYLDGTAEYSGSTELPQMDQGITVLHVWSTGAELRRTPIVGAERNRRERTVDIALAADGGGAVTVNETLTGNEASSHRSRYQADGTRRERLERTIRNIFPGVTIESEHFESLTSLEEPVRFGYRARVPQIAVVEGNEARMSATVMDDLVRRLAPTASRRYPLDLGGTMAYVETRTIHLPAGFHATSLPSPQTAESRFGRLHVEVESTSTTAIRAVTEFVLLVDRVSAEDYPAFRQWIEEADAIIRQRIQLARGEE